MTWFRFTRCGPWHAQLTNDRDGLGIFYIARCWRETRWPQSVRHDDPAADGAGSLNYASTTENAEGLISTPSGVDDYAVAPSGILSTSDVAGVGGGPFRQGAVSSDGRFAFLCGEVVPGSPPILFLFVRKS